MHRLMTAYYVLVLVLFGTAWQQGYAVSSLFSQQQHGPRVPGQTTYHK